MPGRRLRWISTSDAGLAGSAEWLRREPADSLHEQRALFRGQEEELLAAMLQTARLVDMLYSDVQRLMKRTRRGAKDRPTMKSRCIQHKEWHCCFLRFRSIQRPGSWGEYVRFQCETGVVAVAASAMMTHT